jgi:hypothetical protein
MKFLITARNKLNGTVSIGRKKNLNIVRKKREVMAMSWIEEDRKEFMKVVLNIEKEVGTE